MKNSISDTPERKVTKPSFFRRWGKYAAFGAFMFFLLKGIGWVVLLGLAILGVTS